MLLKRKQASAESQHMLTKRANFHVILYGTSNMHNLHNTTICAFFAHVLFSISPQNLCNFCTGCLSLHFFIHQTQKGICIFCTLLFQPVFKVVCANYALTTYDTFSKW